MRIFIWKNYLKWLKKIFSSPKYYMGIILWLPMLVVNLYISVMLLSVVAYGIISWGIFTLLGDPGFIKSSTSYDTQQIEKAIEIDSTGKMFVACCVSGGGSRSAIFAGETLYLLNTINDIEDADNAFQNKTKKSTNILNSFDFISSVSGGSVAAASLCIQRPWESTAGWEKYKKSLQIPFQHKLYQYLANPLYFGEIALTHRDRTNIMEKVWNDYIVENKKMGDLALRPRLLVNATSYNLGKKFVFTTLSKANFHDMLEVYPALFTNLDPFPTAAITLDEFQLSSVNCPISTALAASSAFPVGLPPVTITGYKEQQSINLHLSDGGIYDNHGIETILQLFKQKIDNYYNGLQMRIFGGLVFVIDASLPAKERVDSPTELDMILHTMEVYEKRMQIYFDRFLRDQVNISGEIRIPLKFIRFSLGELVGIWHLAQKTPEERREILQKLQQQLDRGVHATNLDATQQFLDEWFQKPQEWWGNFNKKCSEIIGTDVNNFMKEVAGIPTNFALSKRQIQVVEKAAQLIFSMKQDEVRAAYKNLQDNLTSFKNIEDFTRRDIAKNPTLYIFEFMRRLQLANNDTKVWVGDYAPLQLAFRRLSLPQALQKKIQKTIEDMQLVKNQEAAKTFDNSLQVLKEQCAKAFAYNSLNGKQRNTMWRTTIFFIFVCGLLLADDKHSTTSLTIKKIMADPEVSVGSLPSAIRWSHDSSGIYFRGKTVAENDLYRVDVTSWEVVSVDKMEISASMNKDNTAKVYIEKGDIFFSDLKTNATRQLTKTIEYESGAYFSPHSDCIVFTKGQNLYLWSLKDNCYEQVTNFVKGHQSSSIKASSDPAQEWLEKQQLELIKTLHDEDNKSKDKKPQETTSPCEIYTENCTLQNVKLSRDEKYVTFRLHKAGKAKPTIVPNYTTTSGYTQNLNARSKVGTVRDTSKMGVFDRNNNKVYFVDTSQIPGIKDHPPHVQDKTTPRDVIIHGPFWSEKTNDCIVVVLANDNKDRWIMKLDLSNGKLSLIDRQTDEAWIGGPGVGGWRWSPGNIGFIPHTSFLWFQSEETGYAHLYIYDLEKKEKKQLTSGAFEVYAPKISADSQHWYFTANKTHPGERHLFRMPIMGGELTQITSMPGNNETYISPDETKIAIRNSFCNKPWELFVMENKPGSEARQVTSSTSEQFRSYAWRVPEVVTFRNRHGKEVYARLYQGKQSTSRKPAVIFVHGAGYLQNAHKWWSSYFREYMFHNFLVDNGYTVLDIDYSGSAGYGRDWRTAIYRHMGGDDLSDQVDGAKFLIEKCNVDSNNIGIYGGSYGGFITLMAMFKEANTFKAGAALRSVTDWAHYNHPYTSNILNVPHEDEEAYKRSSPIYFAEGLKGALLICHGMLDRNVQFQDVVRLAQRLIELEKDNWELAVYPLEGHSFVEPESWRDEYQRIFQLFEKHLKQGVHTMLQDWNREADLWHKINSKYNLAARKEAIAFVKTISAVRSNLIAALNLGKLPKEKMQVFQKCWSVWLSELKKAGYAMHPQQMGNVNKEVGKVIYCCSPRAQAKKMILVVPGLKKNGKLLLPPVTTVILPSNASFPDYHKAKKFATHWRGILGEVELLTIHVRMQPQANCAIESLYRNKVVPITTENCQKIIDEIKRRKEVFERSLASQASDYQIATNYWRLEECFWSLFHDDNRPFGHSFFDMLCKRVQDWRGFLARKHKIFAKDFVVHKDSLGAINSYVEGIIVKKKSGVPQGKVLRQLRPALTLQEKQSKRTLKGRVIST